MNENKAFHRGMPGIFGSSSQEIPRAGKEGIHSWVSGVRNVGVCEIERYLPK